jgi:hypothetical protein
MGDNLHAVYGDVVAGDGEEGKGCRQVWVGRSPRAASA